jgi:integrase
MNLEREICPRCGGTKCYIMLRYKGKGDKTQRTYYYRRDDTGEVFRCITALQMLGDINKAMKSGRFDPVAFTDASIAERRFENQYALFSDEMRKAYESGDWSYGHYINLKGYRKHYYGWFDGLDVKEIDLQVLKRFVTTLSGKSKTKKNIMGMLHKFFGWLFDRGTIPTVPSFPEIRGGDEARRRALRRSEQMAGLENTPSAHRDVIEFMMHTGCRPSEAIAILVRSVELENRLVWIERVRDGCVRYLDRTKNREKLPVPLNDTALQIVAKNVKDKFPKQALFINPNTGKAYTRWCLWDTWKRFSGADVTLYEATRHSFCSQISGKVDARQGQRLMRHRDAQSTNRYYHEWAENLVDAVKKIDTVVSIDKKARQKRDNF